MRRLTTSLLVLAMLAPLTGCIVRSRGHGHGHGHAAYREAPRCGPAYHWNGRACVHNGRGKAKGHHK